MSRRVLLLAPLVVLLAGCGSNSKPQRALAPVRLTVDAPLDPATVDGGSVEVHGRVWPASAQVRVAGDQAGVDGGGFSAVVSLDPGANVIDVEAGAPRRAAAMTAVRVVRRVPVEVPDLTGKKPDDAVRALEQLGLKAQLRDTGGLLDQFLPGDARVCTTEPGAGARVRAGSTVQVDTAKSC